jgi:hypothetical protein
MDARADDRDRARAFRLDVVSAQPGLWAPLSGEDGPATGRGANSPHPARRDLRPWQRVPLLALGFVGLVTGIGAGLARLGWSVPAPAAAAAAVHGPLMIGAFLGVVIALERAVAIGRLWAYLAPLFAGIGGIAVIAGATAAGAWLLAAGSVVLLAASIDIVRRQPALFTFTLALGALCWTIGNLLWAAGSSPHDVVAWWLAFPILTIAGERLELSRFMPPSPPAKRAFALILAVLVTGVAAVGVGGTGIGWGTTVFGAALGALALWLGTQDIARRTVRGRGLTRYIAVCLLSGYAWLALGAGAILAAGSLTPGTAFYDAAIHALAIGFVFAMIFGHAPIIVPAVLRVQMPYHPGFYAPLAVLHVSLAVRIAGDALGAFPVTRFGGLLNAVAIAAFIACAVTAVARGRRRGRL